MVFAKVVLGLPIEGPFDYLIPEELEPKVKIGARCIVPFRNRKMVGFIVGLSGQTDIKKVKPVYDIIDEAPLLSDEMLILTKEVSNYYLCSWGEAIETALPKGLRLTRAVNWKPENQFLEKHPKNIKSHTTLIHDLSKDGRWKIYLERITENIKNNKGTIFLTPYIEFAIEAQKMLKESLNQDIALLHSQQAINDSISEWVKIKNNRLNLVVGTRQAIFAPVNNLGLIIIDNESDESYKQGRTPHYNARGVAFMRAKINKANLLLADTSPSLEMYYLVKKKKYEYIFIGRNGYPEIKIIDIKRGDFYKRKQPLISMQLQNILTESLERKEKIIIFLNRKGFATCAICPNCHTTLRCGRCNVNLVYHFKEDKLICHYCNQKTEVPRICPTCNASYIRYSGMGTEKIESELSRIYPKAKISIVEGAAKLIPRDADILVSTAFIFKHRPINFDLIIVSSIDNTLNRADFRATEKAFAQLVELATLNPKKLIIQTFIPGHYCFSHLKELEEGLFYKKELTLRKQLNFPPFSHITLIKVRGKNRDRVKEGAQSLFDKLNKRNSDKAIRIVSCFPGQPSKLRGNFYWQILIKSKSMEKISGFLKKYLKGFSHSGIIVTVDVDPF